MTKFDPVPKQHVSEVERGASHTSYLGKQIQNELIDCIGGKIMESIVNEIKENNYFSIILDCTPDLSHKEQLSVIIFDLFQLRTPLKSKNILSGSLKQKRQLEKASRP